MRLRTAALGALALLAVGTAGAGALVAVRAGEALPGTTVAGVDVGGLGRDDVRARLVAAVEARSTGTLELVHDELSFSVDRAALPLDVDLEATADAAVEAGRDDGLDTVLGPLLGRGEPVDLSATVQQGPLRQRIDDLAAQVDRPMSAGTLTFDGADVATVAPAEGRRLDRDAAVEALAEAVLLGRREALPLPVDEEQPPTTEADVEAVAAQARAVLSAPLRLSSPEAALEVAPQELSPLLSLELVDGALSLQLDQARLTELVEKKARTIDRAPVEAGFDVPQPPTVDTQGDLTWSPQPAAVAARPGSPGRAVQVAPAVAALQQLVATGGHEAPLPVDVVPPRFAATEASAAGISSLLGTFTTYFQPGQPRVTNIRTIARVVDGSYVPPGETFSLNRTAGPRTLAKGYVADSAIIDGELVDSVGGGVSQFATTLFNAAFFAGLPIEQHKPHSFYISRYPAGRESTVSYGSIDVVVRNDTANGMVVKTWSTPRSVTVAIYGDNGGRTVSSSSGPRRPRDGGGFTIEVTRTVTGGDGKGGRRVFRTSYNPPPD